jgi:hypothetical protein
MNERIRELAEQAQDWADAQAPCASEEHEYFYEKFAELLLHECFHALHRAGYGEAVEPVKKHFLKNAELSNVATDYVVNAFIEENKDD